MVKTLAAHSSKTVVQIAAEESSAPPNKRGRCARSITSTRASAPQIRCQTTALILDLFPDRIVKIPWTETITAAEEKPMVLGANALLETLSREGSKLAPIFLCVINTDARGTELYSQQITEKILFAILPEPM